MGMMKEFREFAFKGNVVDLAVGVIIGAAFGKIVKGVVDDLIMPIVSLALPQGDWRQAALTLREVEGEGAANDVRLLWGDLVGAALDFLIVGIVLFLAVRGINRLRRKDEDSPKPAVRECPACLESISAKATRCRACTSEVTPVAA